MEGETSWWLLHVLLVADLHSPMWQKKWRYLVIQFFGELVVSSVKVVWIFLEGAGPGVFLGVLMEQSFCGRGKEGGWSRPTLGAH